MAAGDITDDMVATIRHRLGDPGGLQWDDSELLINLNEALRMLADYLKDGALFALTEVKEQALTTAVNSYALPTDFLRERRVVYIAVPAVKWDLDRLQALSSNAHYTPAATEPYYLLWDAKIELLVGGVVQGGTDSVDIWYIKQPTTVTTSVDPEVGRQYRNVLEDMVVEAALSQGEMPFSEQAQVMHEIALRQLGQINSHWGAVPPHGGFANDPEV